MGGDKVKVASASPLLLANNLHGGEHLKDLLVGQILWVSHAQLMGAAFITLSVLLVGIYPVFASLIVPALAVRGMRRERGLAVACLVMRWGLLPPRGLTYFQER